MAPSCVTLAVEVSAMPMRSLFVALPLSLVLAAAAGGCGGTAASEQVASASSAATRAPVAQSGHGVIKLVGDALGDVPLTPAQRAEIETLAADCDARHAQARAARKDLMLAVAAQVDAGAVDREALRPKIDALAAAANASQPADRAAFERLHAILGPDQRTAFVDALEARVLGRFREARAKHPWKQWSDDLRLTEAQRTQVKASLEQRFQGGKGGAQEHGGPWHERGAKLLNAFKQDRFVLDEIAPPRDVGQQATQATDHVLGVAEAVLPVLTPEQRSLAAQKLRDRAEASDETGLMTP
jgi:Spy/CpxP family protein refolding chaperone